VFADARGVVAAVPCEERPRPEPTTGPVEKPPPPDGGGDGAALLADAEAAAKTSQWARAATLGEKAYAAATASSDGAMRARAAMVVTLAACNLKDARRATKYLALATASTKPLLRQRCLANGVSID